MDLFMSIKAIFSPHQCSCTGYNCTVAVPLWTLFEPHFRPADMWGPGTELIRWDAQFAVPIYPDWVIKTPLRDIAVQKSFCFALNNKSFGYFRYVAWKSFHGLWGHRCQDLMRPTLFFTPHPRQLSAPVACRNREILEWSIWLDTDGRFIFRWNH